MKKALEIISNALLGIAFLLFGFGCLAIESDSAIPFICIVISIAYFDIYATFLQFKGKKIVRRKRCKS